MKRLKCKVCVSLTENSVMPVCVRTPLTEITPVDGLISKNRLPLVLVKIR